MRTRTKKRGAAHPKGGPAEAVAAVHAGEKQSAVAKRYGVTRQAVNQWVKAVETKEEHVHGLRHLTEPQRRKVRKRVVALVKAGVSQAATARRFGVSEFSVGKWLKLYDKGGLPALNIVQFEDDTTKPSHGNTKKIDEREKHFHLRFDIHERPVVANKTAGSKLAENYVGETVVCHQKDHHVVGAYFDERLGIVLSYIYVPIEGDPTL